MTGNIPGIKLPPLAAGESVTIQNNTLLPVDVYQHDTYTEAMAAAAQATAAQATAAPRWSLAEKLAMRLNLNLNQQGPFELMQPIANPTANTIVVFLIVNGKPLCIEDDANLFPSDSLIARLNLLR